MKEYFLHLADLRMVLRTPDDIQISERLRPFLCEPHQELDCTITVQLCAVLPHFMKNGEWHGTEYYDFDGENRRIFHCHAPGAAAYAVTYFYKNGNVEIRTLQEYLAYFTGTSGIFNRIGMETLLQQYHGLLLHASLIQYAGKAIALSGPSGVGKSTQAELWHSCLGASILNGDRAILRKTEKGWMAYGSPYAGTSGIYKNEQAPLAAVVLLQQAERNFLQKVTPIMAFSCIYPEISVHHWDRSFVEKTTDQCLQLMMEIPVYKLECLPEEGAVQLLKKGLGL